MKLKDWFEEFVCTIIGLLILFFFYKPMCDEIEKMHESGYFKQGLMSVQERYRERGLE